MNGGKLGFLAAIYDGGKGQSRPQPNVNEPAIARTKSIIIANHTGMPSFQRLAVRLNFHSLNGLSICTLQF